MTSAVLLTLASVLGVSLLSLLGVLLFLISERRVRAWLLPLVSFSTGGLLGDVFLHMLPELAEDPSSFSRALSVLLLGILLSFVIEKLIHWRHCHDMGCGAHVLPLGVLSLIGDAIHNAIDGMLIAASYLVSLPIGFATTVAILFHEIPQEMGDFAILIFSGFAKKRALFWNLISSLSAFAGALLILLSSTALPSLGRDLLPLAAGNFLYIAGADLIPELHKEVSPGRSLLQLLAMILGIAVMYALTLLE